MKLLIALLPRLLLPLLVVVGLVWLIWHLGRRDGGALRGILLVFGVIALGLAPPLVTMGLFPEVDDFLLLGIWALSLTTAGVAFRLLARR